MKYQLVLQFPATSLDDYDTFVALEEILRQKICDFGEIDGHDFGSGEMNIFIIISNFGLPFFMSLIPKNTFIT
jgi:hypothetical protein